MQRSSLNPFSFRVFIQSRVFILNSFNSSSFKTVLIPFHSGYLFKVRRHVADGGEYPSTYKRLNPFSFRVFIQSMNLLGLISFTSIPEGLNPFSFRVFIQSRSPSNTNGVSAANPGTRLNPFSFRVFIQRIKSIVQRSKRCIR